jgi:REP element-mobilizing transposase RayT
MYTTRRIRRIHMADTYIQVYVQAVFAVEGRQSLISPRHKDEIYKYIAGTLKEQGQKLMAINGMQDHVHILFGMSGTISLSDLIKEIKASSSRLINDKKWLRGHFNWQSGYGAFSYSRSQISRVAAYIENQEHHHARKSFREEYTTLLKRFEVEYKPEYLFDFIDER